jgi:hypothetical protein
VGITLEIQRICNEWGNHMKIEIKGNEVVITLPLNNPLPLSKSEKSLMLATSNGIVPTTTVFNGKVVKAGVNVFVDK